MSRIIIHSRNYVPIINRSINPFRTIQGRGGPKLQIPPRKSYNCSICEKEFRVPNRPNRMLFPRKCLNDHVNPHPICNTCWFGDENNNGFVYEDGVNHPCPGCVKGLPHIYYGLSREERRKRLVKPKSTDIIIDLVSDSDDDESSNKKQKT